MKISHGIHNRRLFSRNVNPLIPMDGTESEEGWWKGALHQPSSMQSDMSVIRRLTSCESQPTERDRTIVGGVPLRR